MDLDDSFTERIRQKIEARKEYINEKKREIDMNTVGKKRVALVEEHQLNSEGPPEESPKRHCTEALQSAYSSYDKENVEMQDDDSNSAFIPITSVSKVRGLAALKKNYFNEDHEDSKRTSEQLDIPKSVKSPVKSVPGFSSNEIKQNPVNLNSCQKESNSDDESIDDGEIIDENDFTENYNDIKSDQVNDEIEMDCSSVKQIRKPEMLNQPIKDEKPKSLVLQDSNKSNVDPAELPLSARKALFEKALLGGTPKINDTVVDHQLSVAQRAAMFENASKATNSKATNFKGPNRIVFSKFEKGNNTEVTKSPVKTVQQVAKPVSEKITASPVKKITSAASVPSPTKAIGNHTRLIQQKLIESSGCNSQNKEVAKVVEERKQEIFSLVNHWEKLSSLSNMKNNSEGERNQLPSDERVSFESDEALKSKDNEESECDEIDVESVNDANNHVAEEENDDGDYSDDDNDRHEDNVQNVFYRQNSESHDDDNDKHEDNVQNGFYRQNSESHDGDDDDDRNEDSVENVFYRQESETENLNYVEENANSEHNADALSILNQNSKSEVSSFGSISSFMNSNNYNNASNSVSCSSGNSVRSHNLTSSTPQDEREDARTNKKENKNPEIPLLYTVSFYRKQKEETKLTPVRTIVRREKVSSPESPPEADYTKVIQERLKGLQEEILRQQTVISQTSQALNLCSATAEFSGSTEQVEGERLLLIATQKRQACLNEITRLKTCGAQRQNVGDGTGTLTITDLQLPLKREFIASQLEGKGNDTVHYFLCLIRHGAQVIVTQMMSSDDKSTNGALCFTNHIQLRDLPADFSVVFEVFALQTKKEVLPHEKKYHIKREHSKIRLTPKGRKMDGKILLPAISSPGGPNAVRSPSFGVVGFTRFTLQNCNKKVFHLDKVPFTSPLEGELRVQLQLHAEHKIMEKGFLTMFEDVSGFGAWHRRWCALDANQLAYWKYPDDEHKKEPIGTMDLKQCITNEVKLVSRDVCARPHTFQLVTVRPQRKGDKNTLISRSANTLTTTKHLLSADTKDERIVWCNKLNEALTNIRKWDPQALRPIESMQDSLNI